MFEKGRKMKFGKRLIVAAVSALMIFSSASSSMAQNSAVTSESASENKSVSDYEFSWSGGSGRVIITCSAVFEKDGQFYATIQFSKADGGSSSYTKVKSLGETVSGDNTFTIPVNRNENTEIEAMTTAMSEPHWISYTIYVGVDDSTADSGETVSVSDNTETFDEEAPEVTGLNAGKEVKTKYSDLLKIFSYGDGIYLIEVDMVSGTDREDASGEDSQSESSDETSEAADDEAVQSESEDEQDEAGKQTKDVYLHNVVKYLVVPEDTEVPAGLEKNVIIIQQPADHVYAASEDAIGMMDDLDVTGAITLSGVKAENTGVESLSARMAEDYDVDDAVTYAGTYDDWDLRTLLKEKADLAVLPSDILSMDDFDEEFGIMADQAIELDMPVFIDRSADEVNDLAKAEWYKAYGVIFGDYKEGVRLFHKAVKSASEEEKQEALDEVTGE
ncbi:MAG: hypothetical protein ACOYA9_09620 [Bilifractor sp.]|jgi:hypothetical protein